MRISDWSSDVCSSDLAERHAQVGPAFLRLNGGSELAGERVDDEEIAAGAAHFEPDARNFARLDRTPRTAAQGHENAPLGLVLERHLDRDGEPRPAAAPTGYAGGAHRRRPDAPTP